MILASLFSALILLSGKPGPTPKEKNMSIEEIHYLPFGINKETPLDQIEITLNFYGAKTGAGRQEISLRGDGSITLYFTLSMQDNAPKIIKSKCDPEMVLRLLDFMEGLGLFSLPEEQPSHGHQHARRLLSVKLPDRTKNIALDEAGFEPVEQIIGAIMLTAGQCVPEALNNRFFPNL